jgi:hypothetical protein
MTSIDNPSQATAAELSDAVPPTYRSGRDKTAPDIAVAARPQIDMGSRPPSDLVDDKAASTYLGVTAGTLSVWRSTGRYPLPFVKVGRRVRYRIGDLLAFVESRTQMHT